MLTESFQTKLNRKKQEINKGYDSQKNQNSQHKSISQIKQMVDSQLKNKVKEKKMKKILAKVDKFKNNQRPKIVSFEDFDDLISNEVNTEEDEEDQADTNQRQEIEFFEDFDNKKFFEL